MNSIITRCASVALLTAALGACSSSPKSLEQTLIEQPVRSAPFELTTSSRGPKVTLNDVLFDFEKATLRPQATGVIEQAAKFLDQNPGRVALIEGHTDHTGDARYNVLLSEARSEVVRDALIAAGAPKSRIQTESFGETRPVASNNTPEGRQQNRRVEIIFKANTETTFTQL